MHIAGFRKTTLLDYPHKIAATIFLAGCNFSCPFCHNSGLIKNSSNSLSISKDEIFQYLKKRQSILEGVCITGGEATLNPDLPEFIQEIKALNYLVKLDTNGSNPNMLASLISNQLIDYVAMDIKNSPENYDKTSGCKVDLSAISKSIELLLSNKIEYEFRTTVVKGLHTTDDFLKIGPWIDGAKQYFLQGFIESEQVLCKNMFSSFDRKSLEEFCFLLEPHVKSISIRGVD